MQEMQKLLNRMRREEEAKAAEAGDSAGESEGEVFHDPAHDAGHMGDDEMAEFDDEATAAFNAYVPLARPLAVALPRNPLMRFSPTVARRHHRLTVHPLHGPLGRHPRIGQLKSSRLILLPGLPFNGLLFKNS